MSPEVAAVRVDEPEAPRGPSAGGAGGAGAGAGGGGAGAGAGGAGAGGARGPEGGATRERQARGRRWPLAVLLSVLVLLLGVVGYGATLAPTHVSQLRERASDGKTAEALGWGAQVVVPDGWAVRPLVREVISWPPLPPLLDWSVVFGADTGLALSTPDRVLDVDVVGLSSADTDAALFAARADEILGADRDRGAALPLRTEQLASGATLTHLDGDREILAIVDTGHVRVSALAHLADGAGGGDARAGDAGAEAPTLDEYRPVLGQLLEQITAQ